MWRSTVRSDDPLPPPAAHAPPPVMAASDGPGHSVPGRMARRGADMTDPIDLLDEASWLWRPGAPNDEFAYREVVTRRTVPGGFHVNLAAVLRIVEGETL